MKDQIILKIKKTRPAVFFVIKQGLKGNIKEKSLVRESRNKIQTDIWTDRNKVIPANWQRILVFQVSISTVNFPVYITSAIPIKNR